MKIEELDISKEHCPMTFVKTKLKLDKLEKGTLLKVTLGGGEPLENLPRSVTEQGHKVISISELENGLHLVEIEKGD